MWAIPLRLRGQGAIGQGRATARYGLLIAGIFKATLKSRLHFMPLRVSLNAECESFTLLRTNNSKFEGQRTPFIFMRR